MLIRRYGTPHGLLLFGVSTHHLTARSAIYDAQRKNMGWNQRWIVLRRFGLEVYKNKEALIPLNKAMLGQCCCC